MPQLDRPTKSRRIDTPKEIIVFNQLIIGTEMMPGDLDVTVVIHIATEDLLNP